jgi:hypothetical protein
MHCTVTSRKLRATFGPQICGSKQLKRRMHCRLEMKLFHSEGRASLVLAFDRGCGTTFWGKE